MYAELGDAMHPIWKYHHIYRWSIDQNQRDHVLTIEDQGRLHALVSLRVWKTRHPTYMTYIKYQLAMQLSIIL